MCGAGVPPEYPGMQLSDYLSINSVRTIGLTLCPNVWLPYAPEYVEKPLREARGFDPQEVKGWAFVYITMPRASLPLFQH